MRISVGLLLALLGSCCSLECAPITLSFTQYFDFADAGVVGTPYATWVSTFELNDHPTNPFSILPQASNSDFGTNGFLVDGTTISLVWISDSVLQFVATTFTFGGELWTPFGSTSLETSCDQPCTATALFADGYTTSSGGLYFALTSDVLSGAEAVPEGNTFFPVLTLSLICSLFGYRKKSQTTVVRTGPSSID